MGVPHNADLREDTHGEDDHPRGGGHPPRPAAPHLRGQAARGWPHSPGLQHPEGVYSPPGAPPVRIWSPQVQPMEEVHSQDALEVEEEAHASPPKEAPQDASTLQVIARLAMELPVEPVCQ